MSNHANINAAVLGFGFMGRTHAKCYQDAQAAGYPVTLAAIADPNIHNNQGQPAGNIDTDQSTLNLDHVTQSTDAQELLEDPSIHLISICTHTESHVDLAIAAACSRALSTR